MPVYSICCHNLSVNNLVKHSCRRSPSAIISSDALSQSTDTNSRDLLLLQRRHWQDVQRSSSLNCSSCTEKILRYLTTNSDILIVLCGPARGNVILVQGSKTLLQRQPLSAKPSGLTEPFTHNPIECL